MPRPHGGRLVNRVLSGKRRERLIEEIEGLQRLTISQDVVSDVVNIAKGTFSPLEGFLLEEDYIGVLEDMRLSNDLPWTIPVILDVSESQTESLREGDAVSLWVEGDGPIAVMRVEEKYRYDKTRMAEKIFKTRDVEHPSVAKIYRMKDVLLGGKIQLVNDVNGSFQSFALTPVETRVLFKEKGWKTVAGFQTRNVPHLGHEYVQKTALNFVDGIFINPIIGKKKRGDFKDEVILETYEALIRNYYLKDVAVLAILRTEMRYAGPREAIFHTVVRKNFGCTHFIVGRDHAGVGNYYGPYEAQEIFDEFPDLGVTPIFFKSFFYCKRCGGVENERTCPHHKDYRLNYSGTKIRRFLMMGKGPSKELMRPEIAKIILNWDKPFVE